MSRPALSAEVQKLRTVGLVWALLVTMVGLTLLAISVHVFGLPTDELARQSAQQRVLSFGVSVGAVFSALLGALSITTEHRYGTIRPTFLGTPDRLGVLGAKASVSSAVGFAFGVFATCLALLTMHVELGLRDVPALVSHADAAQLVLGGGAAGALLSTIGLGVGCCSRSQVPAIIGIFVWLFVIENLLIDGVPAVSRFLPGSLAQGVAGSPTGTLTSPVAALVLLTAYAVVAVLLGAVRTRRGDIA